MKKIFSLKFLITKYKINLVTLCNRTTVTYFQVNSKFLQETFTSIKQRIVDYNVVVVVDVVFKKLYVNTNK